MLLFFLCPVSQEGCVGADSDQVRSDQMHTTTTNGPQLSSVACSASLVVGAKIACFGPAVALDGVGQLWASCDT